MTHLVLARKWRPQNLDQVVGQDHIVQALKNIAKNSKVAHAYLFSGTRGIGKTTVARIFAKSLVCESSDASIRPCLKCNQCLLVDHGKHLDIVEIDGASNNSVDHVRSLIENVQYLPASAKRKVYIIDEVHMLSTSAFNALLKTIEEPPPHVVFIFATTDPEKLMGTVLSRLQKFEFKTSTEDTIKSFLSDICKREEIIIKDQEVLSIISKEAKGSFRDALSYLDQVLCFSPDKIIELENVYCSLGIVRADKIRNLAYAIVTGDCHSINAKIDDIFLENIELKKAVNLILDLFFSIIQSYLVNDKKRVMELLGRELPSDITSGELIWCYEVMTKDFSWALDSINPEKTVRIILQKVMLRREIISGEGQRKFDEKKEDGEGRGGVRQEMKSAPIETAPTIKNKPTESLNNIERPAPDKEVKDWNSFLSFLYTKSPASAANLEQGNILDKVNLINGLIKIDLAFSTPEKVFFDYLNDQNVKQKLLDNLSLFYEWPKEKIALNIKLIDSEFKNKTNFKSISEQEELKKQQSIDQKKNDLLNHKLVMEAGRIFNTTPVDVTVKN